MPFFAYATAVSNCVPISAPRMYLSIPAGTPPSAHLKQRSAAIVSVLVLANVAAERS